jgi:hypothetical protein
MLCDSDKDEHSEVQNIRSVRWNNFYLNNWNKNSISFETTVYTHVSLTALANVALTYCLIQKHSADSSSFYLQYLPSLPKAHDVQSFTSMSPYLKERRTLQLLCDDECNETNHRPTSIDQLSSLSEYTP